MAGSVAEREIRDAVAAFARQRLAGSRIVHELVVGGCRADLAAIQRDRITLFEIKSERDTLDRLPEQLKHFGAAGHATVVVAHRIWFDETPYDNGNPRLAWPDAAPKVWPAELWCYPEPTAGNPFGMYQWQLPRPTLRQPHAERLLELLWRDELIAEAARHRIAVPRRARIPDIMADMAWLMTGREISEAVCRQLRMRPFPEADEPICGPTVDRETGEPVARKETR